MILFTQRYWKTKKTLTVKAQLISKRVKHRNYKLSVNLKSYSIKSSARVSNNLEPTSVTIIVTCLHFLNFNKKPHMEFPELLPDVDPLSEPTKDPKIQAL